MKSVLDAVLKLHSVHDPSLLVNETVKIASTLIPCPAVAYNEIDLEAKTAKVIHNFSAEADPLLPLMAQFIHENPIIVNHSKHPDAATKFSDFVSRSEFRKTNFYNAFMRPLELERQLAIWVRNIPGITVTLSLQRGKNDFSELDRSILQILAPHFRLAFMNAARFQEAATRTREIFSGLEDFRTGMIFLNTDQNITEITPYASKCLQWFFGRSDSNKLPDPLLRWLKSRETGHADNLLPSSFYPYVVENHHGRLTVRVCSSPQGQSLMLSHQSSICTLAGQKLGLTPREAEVLFWLSEGKTDEDISRILSISIRTANKHAENIRRKLNVETRSAAARLLLEIV